MSYEKISANQGMFWPCPADKPAENPWGTPRMFAGGFPTVNGRARFHPVQAPGEEPDEDFPLYLTTGRVLAQYQSGTQTRRLAQLNEIAPGPQAEVNPATAERYGLVDGGTVTLETRRSSRSSCLRKFARTPCSLPFIGRGGSRPTG